MKKGFLFFLFIYLVLNPIEGWSFPEKFLAIKKNEPSFSEILTAFCGEQGLNFKKFQDLEKRIRKAAYLPILSLGYDHQLKESESLSVNDNISISGGKVTIGPEDNDIDFDNDVGQTFRARAVWQLDGLLFNRYELSLAKQQIDLMKLKQGYAKELYQIYEKRYQALFEYFRHKGGAPSKAGVFYSKYLLLTDLLDALTGEKFLFWRKP